MQIPEELMSFIYPKHVCFACDRCAMCCGDVKGKVRMVLLLRTEAERIAEETSMDLQEIVEKVEGFKPYVYLIRKTDERKCVFLKENLCSIYRIRPLVCRFYPFHLVNKGNNRYTFKYTHECPGVGNGPLLRRAFYESLFSKFKQCMKENIRTDGT